MSSCGFKIGRNWNTGCTSTSRVAAIVAMAAVLLGYAASANAEIYAFRQIGDQTNINGVTVNLSDAGFSGGRNHVDFKFINIVGSSATKVTDVWLDDRSGNPASSALVLDTFTIENGPGVDFVTCGTGSIPNGTGVCPTFSRNFCASTTGGASNAINQGEYLILHFTLKAGKTIDDVKFWLLQASTTPGPGGCSGTELPALRIAISAGLATGGASSGINNPAPFPPEDCNENGIPDVCDLDCNGFGGQCQVFVGVCGQGLPPVAPPTNVQATPSSICPGQTSTLTATVAAGQTLEWFSGSCGGQIDPIHLGSPFVTDPLNQTTTFFARAKSAAGCPSNCVQVTVTVGDTTPPDVTCPPNPAPVSANGSCQAAVPNIIPGVTASDNCTPAGSLVITQNPTAGTLVGVGTTLITVTVKDQANNMSMCQVQFTVNDTTPPHITSCGPDQSASANGSCMAPVPDFTAGVVASDNCATIDRSLGNITQNPTVGTLVGIGPHTITITVSDDATPPNTATCTATFSVLDTTGPMISMCPNPNTVFVDADASCNALVPDVTAMVVATDNCTPVGQLIKNQSPAPGTPLMGLGTTPITITVTDPGSGLSAQCQTNVTVVDNMPPAITTCAGTQTIPADQPNCQGLLPDLRGLIMATENCPNTVSQIPAPLTLIPLGPNNVQLCVTENGPPQRTVCCNTTVTVIDVTPPEIGQCAPPDSASANANCEATVPDFTSGVIATDDCSTVPNLTITQNPSVGTVVGLGPHTITITVSDQATPPNTSECTTTFTVSDTTAPNFVHCAANQSAPAGDTCQAAVPDFTGGSLEVGDNCSSTGQGTLTITQDPMVGTLEDPGVTVVTITAEDEAGNTATCTATFTVDDTTPPSITCPAPINQVTVQDVCGATINYPPPEVSDNCANRGACGPVTVDCVPPPGSFFPVGTTTVTCTATDCSGNTASCTFTITVTDGDTDEDGVPNCMDDCPGTPSDQRPVDSVGCSCQQEQLQEEPLDSDDDGVPDACDQCPDTPEGQPVNSDGCACSQINCDDGNPCTLDTCTAGVCAHEPTTADGDGDGILDCNDCCPASPPGAVVDETGCQSIGANAGGPYRRACPDTPGIVTIPLGGIGSGQISSCRFTNGVLSLDWTIDCPGITILNPHTENATLVIDTRITGCPLDCNVTLTATLTAETVEPGQLATFTAQASATAPVQLTQVEVPVVQAAPGACCFIDSTCASAADAATCSAAGGNFAGAGTDCSTITCKCGKPQGVSLLFSTLSFAPVCGSGCLTMIPLMFIGLLTLRGSRSVRRSKSDRR